MDVLALEQYGSQAGLAVNFQSLNMQIFLDMVCQRKLPVAICSINAKSCYDHIIHGFVALAALQFGVPLTAIQVMFGTIQQLRHVIHTAYGDSLISSKPIQGLGQGNGAGPAIWAIVSSPILNPPGSTNRYQPTKLTRQ